MVDVTATETGTKKVTVTLTDGRFVIHNKGDYRLILNSTVNPFPEPTAWQVIPDSTDTGQDPALIIVGEGFLSFTGEVFCISPGVTVGPFPPGTLTVIDDTHIQVITGVIPYLSSLNVAPFTFYFKFVPTVGPEVDTETVLVNPGVPSFGITGIMPFSANDGTDPPVTVLGFGFTSIGVDDIQVNVAGNLGSGPGITWHVVDDNTLIVDTGFVPTAVAIAAGLFIFPPFDAMVTLVPTIGPFVDSPAVLINPAIDPLATATFNTFTGGAGEIPVFVNVGPGYILSAPEPPITQGTPIVPAFGNDDYTFAVWFRRRDFSGGLLGFAQYILSGIASATFYTGSLETIIASAGGDSVDAPPGTYLDNDMDWHMAVMVRDYSNGMLHLYVDGALSASVPILAPATMEDQSSFIYGTAGGPGIPPCQATGAAWTRALSDAEIQLMYLATVFPP